MVGPSASGNYLGTLGPHERRVCRSSTARVHEASLVPDPNISGAAALWSLIITEKITGSLLVHSIVKVNSIINKFKLHYLL